jgi:hypothetical protein
MSETVVNPAATFRRGRHNQVTQVTIDGSPRRRIMAQQFPGTATANASRDAFQDFHVDCVPAVGPPGFARGPAASVAPIRASVRSVSQLCAQIGCSSEHTRLPFRTRSSDTPFKTAYFTWRTGHFYWR